MKGKCLTSIIADRNFRISAAVVFTCVLFYIKGFENITVMSAIAVFFFLVFPKVIFAFFGVKKSKAFVENVKSFIKTILNGLIYSVTDYWLTLAYGVIFLFLRKYDFEYLDIVICLWAIDIGVGAIYWAVSYFSKKDITQAKSYRASMDEAFKESFIVGLGSFLYLAGRATCWDGPERIILVFEHELGVKFRVLVLVSLSFVHCAIWTKVFFLGTETFLEAIKMMAG